MQLYDGIFGTYPNPGFFQRLIIDNTTYLPTLGEKWIENPSVLVGRLCVGLVLGIGHDVSLGKR